ncbi:MAG: manganese efflux pump [Bacteroidales bacterium]|nr:manganese efflux pump [Bacteroidales bacterium]
MEILTLFLIAISLSFDSFAVSVSTGLIENTIKFWQGVRIAIVFAFFQATMPVIGWFMGKGIEKYISQYDHWIAFGLLTIIGLIMIRESFKKEEAKTFNPLKFTTTIGMGIATSIDALVVGVSLAFVTKNIFLMILIIGSVTFLASMIGMLLGKKVSGKLGKRMEIMGGIILISIGIKILVSNLIS